MIDFDKILLQMRNIEVYYNKIKALDGVNFNLYKGEIHALVGEHHAGKSTLVKVLSGAVKKHKGEIFFKKQRLDSISPKSAINNKIAMFYQYSNLIPSVSAIDNIFAGPLAISKFGIVNDIEMTNIVNEIMKKLSVNIELHKPVGLLPVSQQNLIEIIRILLVNPDLIIFDELSSRLTPDEIEIIYPLILELKEQGKGIIYISHDMDEIFELADRVTILNNGHRVGTEEIKDIDKIKLMKLTYSFMRSREKLKQDNRELYYFKKYNEIIIKNLPVGGIILDADNNIYLINYAALEIFECNDQSLLNKPIAVFFTNLLVEKAEEIIEKINRREQFLWDGIRYGKHKILKMNLVPFNDDDQFLGTILLIEDISEEAYLKEYLLRTERIASIAELAAGTAHEINNPLMIIKNYIVLLQRKITNPEEKMKLQKIEKEMMRIVNITENLLSFSKLQELPLVKVDLTDLISEVILLLEHQINQKRIRLIWQEPDQEILVLGDENKLKQVLINLLINSIEAVLEHGLIKVMLELYQVEGFVEILIQDDGYGIPEENITKIFDPFFSTKTNKKNAGLGLSLCQHIIESHHGIISYSNKELTTFEIRLPVELN